MIGFQQFDYVVFRYGSLGVYLLRFYWRLLHVQINVFISLTRFQPLFKQYYLCYFPLFLFFWDCHYEYVSILNITPHASEALFILFYFFYFCYSNWTIIIDLFSSSVMLSSASTNLFFILTIKFSISDISNPEFLLCHYLHFL